MRFITEITEAVRSHWPDHKPLFVRLSVEDNSGWGPEQSARLAKTLKSKGVDVIDCSSGGITDLGANSGQGDQIQLPGAAIGICPRRHADIMTMAVGLIIHGDQAKQILKRGEGGPDRGRPRDPQQSELADGCRPKIRRGRAVP